MGQIGGRVMWQGFNCPRCGTPVASGVRFCSNCGTQLNWQQPQPPPQQPVQTPYYQQQYQQPPEPPKKKSNVWLMGCLGLIVLAAIIGGIIAAISGSEAPPSTPEDTSPPPISAPAFRVSRSTLFDLLATPADIEPTLVDGEQYAVSGWQRSDLSDGTPRWMARAGEIYAYELIGEPAYKLTLLAIMTGEVEDSTNLMVRALFLIQATGVSKEEAVDVLLELMDKSLADPDKSYKNIAEGSIITVTFYEIMSSMLISVEATQ